LKKRPSTPEKELRPRRQSKPENLPALQNQVCQTARSLASVKFFMRLLNTLRIGFCAALAGASATLAQAAAPDIVAGSWHFAGAARLAEDTNFAGAKTIFALKSSVDFKNLVLTRFSGWLAGSLPFNTNVDSAALVRPLLDDLLLCESFFAMGGRPQGPLNFILAIQLDDPRAQAWQDHLRQALGTPGKSFQAQDATGQRWDRTGGYPFWIARAGNWLLVGGGDDLQALQSEYLRQLSQHGSPGPALGQSWLEADLDWPRLASWMPAPPFSLKPARTQITMTAKAGALRMSAKVTYPQPLSWKFQPWRVPTNIIRDPLISLTAGQDIAALMNPDEPLSVLADNPLAGQFYVWAMGIQGMPFQSYAAWPVEDATNALQRLASQAPAAFNPDLARWNSGSLAWYPQTHSLVWGKLATFLNPTLQVAPETNGQYLMASLFPLGRNNPPPPADFLKQIAGRTNLVYYDWELTSPRLQHWRLLSAMLPIFPRSAVSPAGVASTNRVALAKGQIPPIAIEENWLAGLYTLDNTVTEITRTGPDELTILRKSPFALTSLELVMLSHWLSGTGSPGINPSLLPPRARISGPGANPGGK